MTGSVFCLSGSDPDLDSTMPASPRALRMSSELHTGAAPSFRRPRGPSERGSSARPGTAMTSRPWSRAQRAVIREPLRPLAWTTTTARETPLMILLREGKFPGRGGVP